MFISGLIYSFIVSILSVLYNVMNQAKNCYIRKNNPDALSSHHDVSITEDGEAMIYSPLLITTFTANT